MAQFATTSIFIDKYHPGVNDKCAVSIKVTYNRKRQYFLTPYKFTVKEFEALFSPKQHGGKNKAILSALINTEEKAKQIIEGLAGNFTFEAFTRKFSRKAGDHEDLFILLKKRSEELKAEGRIGTAITFDCTLSSLKKFHTDPKLRLQDVSVTFLKEYHRWMTGLGNSNTTTGMYLRNVRTIFNESEDVVPKESYPFRRKVSEKNKYVIPTGTNIKKALRLEDIQAIMQYIPTSESQAKARDFWLFSYLASGINIKDIALLKFKNIQGGIIHFIREKTKRENANKPVIIKISVSKEITDIIKLWGNKDIDPENYIFPILKENTTFQEQYDAIQLFTSFINDHMKVVAKAVGINSKITTYVARHSFATVQINGGVSMYAIKDSLGHKSFATTQNYLSGFDDETIKKNAGILTDFSSLKKKEE